MKITKKRILYGSIIALSATAVIIGGTLIFRSIEEQGRQVTTNAPKSTSSDDTTEVEALIKKASAAHASRQYDEATGHYRQARTYYEQAGNIEKLAEIDATLSLIAAEKRNTPEPTKPKLAGER